MKKILGFIFLMLFFGFVVLEATVLKVGTGQTYTTIQNAVNASSAGDTIKVLPGTYNEAIIVNKNVVIQGAGYEVTRITSSTNPTITMSNGKIMWFAISSSGGNGAQISSGSITNCVFSGCTSSGVYFPNNSTGSIKNCVLFGNGNSGASGYSANGFSGIGSVTNCIARNNAGGNQYAQFSMLGGLTFSDGKFSGTLSASNNIDVDPLFTSSSDYHIISTSPCWDTGNPGDVDPDGSVSDMGYFGGFDAPVYPVVTELRIIPQGNGVQIKAKARANY